CRPPRH
ncbi:hypothetical protein BN1723_020915, partial [Verticillium longisporum]